MSNDYLQKVAAFVDADVRSVEQLDALGYAISKHPDEFVSDQHDATAWASLSDETREAGEMLARMLRKSPLTPALIGYVAEHMCPDDPWAVMCLFGLTPIDPRHKWTDEQRRAIDVCARCCLAIM